MRYNSNGWKDGGPTLRKVESETWYLSKTAAEKKRRWKKCALENSNPYQSQQIFFVFDADDQQ